MDTAGTVLSRGDAGAAFLGMAYGETTCGQSAGWDAELATEFFADAVGGFSAWPRRTRGLSVQVRRQIRVAGLHGIHTQTAMGSLAAERATQESANDPGDWVVAGFEADAWRNFPRGLLSMAHHRRVDHRSRLTTDVSVRPGPLGPAVAGLMFGRSEIRRAWTGRALSSIYGDELTTLLGLLLSELCASAIDGAILHPDRACDIVLDTAGMASETCERFKALLAGGGSQHLGFHRQVLRAIRLASGDGAEPVSILHGLLREGRASDAAGAAAGAILGARFGSEWFEGSGLLSHNRLHAYTKSLTNVGEAPESLRVLFAAEADLTRREMAFRDEMLAERRTARRDGSIG